MCIRDRVQTVFQDLIWIPCACIRSCRGIGRGCCNNVVTLHTCTANHQSIQLSWNTIWNINQIVTVNYVTYVLEMKGRHFECCIPCPSPRWRVCGSAYYLTAFCLLLWPDLTLTTVLIIKQFCWTFLHQNNTRFFEKLLFPCNKVETTGVVNAAERRQHLIMTD